MKKNKSLPRRRNIKTKPLTERPNRPQGEEDLTKWEYTIEDVERIKKEEMTKLAIKAWRLQESLHILCACLKLCNLTENNGLNEVNLAERTSTISSIKEEHTKKGVKS